MTDADLVRKKLAFIQTCLEDLRRKARVDLIETDVRELRFVEHTLQVAIQAVIDIASHIVSDDRLGEPTTNRELFTLLARGGLLPTELVDPMRRMAGFRNILVHAYTEVDPMVLKDVVVNHVGDLEAFSREIAKLLR